MISGSLAGVLDADAISNSIRGRRTSNFIGSYSTLLSELAALVRSQDVLAILGSVLDRHGESDDLSMGRLIVGLTSRVWEKSDPDELTRLGELIGRNRRMRWMRRSEHAMPWEINDRPADRRTVALAALQQHEHARLTVTDSRLLTRQDTIALLDWFPTAPPEQHRAALSVLHQLASTPADAATANRILEVPSDHPAHEILSDLRGHKLTTDRPDWVQWELDRATKRPTLGTLQTRLRDTIAATQQDPDLWPDVVEKLAGHDDHISSSSARFGWDLTAHPLWPHLTGEETTELWRLGLLYLNHHHPDTNTWHGTGGYTSSAISDWAGVATFGTAALHRPELLADLPNHVWDTWAPAILATPLFDHATEALHALQASATPAAQAAISTAVANLASTDPISFVNHPWGTAPGTDVTNALRTFALNDQAPTDQRDAAIVALRDREPALALKVARVIQATEQNPPEEAIATWAALAADEFLDPLLTNATLTSIDALPHLNIDALTDTSLAAFADLLLQRPTPPTPSTSKGRRDGFHPSTPEAQLQRVEQHVLNTMAARGRVSDLTQLAAGPANTSPVAPYINHVLQRARQREAINHWQPLQPITLNELLSTGDARLIRNNDGLIAVLLEQLAAIQHDLQHRTLYRSLWNNEPGATDAKPKIEDDISDWLAHELTLRLSPHVLVDREIQISRPNHAGIGTRIDITVTSPTGKQLARVGFEAKRVEHPELLTAIDTQLVNRYMQPADLTHGVYIVYWVHPTHRPDTWKKHFPDPSTLASTLTTQAQAHRPARHIEVVILDIGPAK